jgi:hypothetical protein
MVDQNHLRQLANRCLWLSHNCYDLSAAAELRRLASELKEEASLSEQNPQTERQENLKPRAH